MGRALVMAGLVAGMCLSGSTTAVAQPRGVELFGAMLSQPLVKTTGNARVRWLPSGMGYLERDSTAEGVAFHKVDPETGRRSPLFEARAVDALVAQYRRLTGAAGNGLPFAEFQFALGGKAITFAVARDRFLFDLDNRRLRKLMMPDATGPLDQDMQEAGRFSPDFSYYAFVRDYDHLYLFDTRTGAEERLVEGTGESNLIGFLNAGPWFVWSPDSRRIAYFTADQRAIEKYPILHDLERPATVEMMRYPFTPDPNPVLRMRIVDIRSKADVEVAASTVAEPFLRDITWFGDGTEVAFQVVNQWESRIDLKAADAATGRVRTLLVDEVATYHDPIHNFREVEGGKYFTWSSERSGWRHIYLYDRQGKLVRQLTDGEWDTGVIAAIDERGGWVYFNGATELGLEQHFFRVKLDGTGLTKLTPEPGMHRASMDSAGTFFVDGFSSITAPAAATLRASDGRAVRVLMSTDVSAVTELGLLPPELITLKAADGVTDIHALMHKPADFDPAKRYPVIVNVYGGPHTKAVRNAYSTVGFEAALAQLGFLIVQVDARGTLGRGKAFQAANYLQLGQVDVDDHAAAMRQLAMRPYVDGARVGVTGISHGGYMTLMMKLRYPDVYHVGAAGAPLTDLRLGPRQYIGRFMRTPEANPDGYEKASVLNYADRLEGRLLIFHGTDDRNAVIGNTMQLVHKLVAAGRLVDMMIYPEGVHVLEGADGRHNLRNLVSYFLEHLKPDGWERSQAALWRRP